MRSQPCCWDRNSETPPTFAFQKPCETWCWRTLYESLFAVWLVHDVFAVGDWLGPNLACRCGERQRSGGGRTSPPDQQAAWNRHNLDAFMAGYWNSPDLTFFSGGKEQHGWQATIDRYKATYTSPGHEMGTLDFSDLRIETSGPGRGIRSRLLETHVVRWQDAAWPFHADIPKISRRLENHPRPHLRRGMNQTAQPERRRMQSKAHRVVEGCFRDSCARVL